MILLALPLCGLILTLDYMIAASSSNTYSKTFAGIDGAGKRLADEVSTHMFDGTSQEFLHFVAFTHKQ